jgi:PAS domain S-box-containing protein
VNESIQLLHVDEHATTEVATAALKREDGRIDTETAASPATGMEIVAEGDVDCIVSEYELSTQDGIEFLEAVREEYPDLPFILYTAKGSEAVASEAISAGVTDYVRKSTGTDQYTVLANRIVNAVDSFRSQQQLTDRNRTLRRYKRMVDSMGEAACIYDAEGRFELVNEYLADWYATTKAALEGQPSDLIARIRAESDGDPYQALFDGARDEIHGELGGEFSTHGDAVLEYQLTPLTIEGSVEGVVGVVRDITNRKQRQQELQRRKRAMDEAPAGITITDPTEPENPIVYTNDRFRELTGYDENEAHGRNCRFLQGAATATEPVDAMRAAIDNEECVSVELRNYRKDGSEFWSRVSIAPVRSDGSLINYVGFQQDITERKRIERELKQQNERLEEFASVVSHDLRNPLSVASGRVELLKQEVDSDHFEPITRAHDRMESLIDDLLELARAGDTVDDPEQTDIASLAETCWGHVETADATLVTDVECGVEANKSRLRQVFENLFRNAVEHGGTNVTITLGTLDDGFYIADDGAGIPPAVREKIFGMCLARVLDSRHSVSP